MQKSQQAVNANTKVVSKFVNAQLASSTNIDFEVTTDDVQAIIKQHQDLYFGISTFEFNIFEFSKTVGRQMQMPTMAMALIDINGLNTKVDEGKFLKFMVQIYNQYNRSVEYHNDLHGSDVAQHCHYILRT